MLRRVGSKRELAMAGGVAVSHGELKPTPRYAAIVEAASDLARSMGHHYVGAEHLFLAIIHDRHALPTQVLTTAVDPAKVEARLRELMASESYNTEAN
jgi:ATP-dependent Clp protease ATP-binding subunit ClpA